MYARRIAYISVLPLTMAGKNYSFSIPKSINNDSHAIIYFLTFNQTTKISIIAKVNEEEKFYNIEAEVNFSTKFSTPFFFDSLIVSSVVYCHR